MASVSSDYCEHIDMFSIAVRQSLSVLPMMFVIGLVQRASMTEMTLLRN